MSMKSERVAVNTQGRQSEMKPGEHPQTFFKRLREERAARDPAFALRLKISEHQAEFQGDEPLQQ